MSLAASHHDVFKVESNHRDISGRSEIRQSTQCCSIPLSMSTAHHTIGGANSCGFQSRVNDAMGVLRTIVCVANGFEWNERTSNDALKNESVVLLFMMWLRDLSLSCAQSACPHGL
ncbi:hypothetical protein TNCV_2949051 [Trichonephila clavipes]|nr:hypothetical protein TNCV_2949051 [Trichonephila clavipes]